VPEPGLEADALLGPRNVVPNAFKAALQEGFAMSRMSLLSSPLLLGFEEMERLIDRVGKGGDGYPPYNIERIPASGGEAGQGQAEGSREGRERLRITLAVAGFQRDQIEIALEDNQLTIRGRQDDDKGREYIHRGIAARQFSRTFVLADGIEVKAAELNSGLLSIDLVRREPGRRVRRIEIGSPRAQTDTARAGESRDDAEKGSASPLPRS
jgi:HSP20 family molecular chaperone IbpA